MASSSLLSPSLCQLGCLFAWLLCSAHSLKPSGNLTKLSNISFAWHFFVVVSMYVTATLCRVVRFAHSSPNARPSTYIQRPLQKQPWKISWALTMKIELCEIHCNQLGIIECTSYPADKIIFLLQCIVNFSPHVGMEGGILVLKKKKKSQYLFKINADKSLHKIVVSAV